MHSTLLSYYFIYFSVAFNHQWKLSSAADVDTELCTAKYLMPTDDNAIRMMADMISPLDVDSFFGNGYEQQSTAILNRPQGYYSSLIDLGVIIDYLRLQGQSHGTSNLSGSQHLAKKISGMASLEDNKIEHGGNWKLIKRVWKNGDWWSSSPNMSTIPFEVVVASFQRHGYSILVNKIQNFHSPVKKGEVTPRQKKACIFKGGYRLKLDIIYSM